MRPVRRFYVGSHPCQGYRKTSYNGWDWGLLSTGSLKFRELEPDEANGEILVDLSCNCTVHAWDYWVRDSCLRAVRWHTYLLPSLHAVAIPNRVQRLRQPAL